MHTDHLPPWCHAEPMHAVPTGWRCRVTSTVAGYDCLLGEVVVLTDRTERP
jgi:hypothetical protein